jgi:hypothetical protein
LSLSDIILFDRSEQLLPQYSDCVPVRRLHVFAVIDNKTSLSPRDTSLLSQDALLVQSSRRLDGWVSVSGRTIEDNAPILSIVKELKG